jgi:hypothetical protein
VIDAILKRKVPVTEDVVRSCVVGMLDKMPREIRAPGVVGESATSWRDA